MKVAASVVITLSVGCGFALLVANGLYGEAVFTGMAAGVFLLLASIE